MTEAAEAIVWLEAQSSRTEIVGISGTIPMGIGNFMDH
jgi:hypothetical protein